MVNEFKLLIFNYLQSLYLKATRNRTAGLAYFDYVTDWDN